MQLIQALHMIYSAIVLELIQTPNNIYSSIPLGTNSGIDSKSPGKEFMLWILSPKNFKHVKEHQP